MSSRQSSDSGVVPSLVVTGAAGFIGRRVTARLAAAGARVIAVDRVPAPGAWPPGVEYRWGDMHSELAVQTAPAVWVHLAWIMSRADAKAQGQSVDDFVQLLQSHEWLGVVGLGSAEEYGELEGRLHEDQAPGTRLSPYGQAKHAACRALATWAHASGRKAVWLRPFIAYGPGQVGDMAIPYALRCARDRMTAGFSEGSQARDFVHVDDVADGIARAALGLAASSPGFEICNLGWGEPVRLRDILERIARNLHAEDLFCFGARPMRPGEPREQYADTTRAARRLGWQARVSWKEGIDALCREVLE
jgi:nucleoside-diphosphate-sugar epimerase